MSTKNKYRFALKIIPLVLLFLLIVFGAFYTSWNSASPAKTCSSCHEIESSVNMLAQSYHRKLQCSECHGTALSNGIHSLKEKGAMVVSHISNDNFAEISLKEEQVLSVMKNCTRCHADEYAGWKSGGHSAKYKDIFLNEKHNRTEQLNFDCLRCHGMFSDTDIVGIAEPLNIEGPWKFKNNLTAEKPVIPCLACHQVHFKGNPGVSPDYSNPQNAFYSRLPANSKVSFYNRQDKTPILAENLPKLVLWHNNRQVEVSDDFLMRNCVQCHAPNARHQAGTSDDRTPLGVHEGLSCLDCHDPHSNDARNSCKKCHPAVSNCNLDVTTMNTTFANPESPNNIHRVACIDCHEIEKRMGFPNRK